MSTEPSLPPPPPPRPRRFLTLDQVAEELNVSHAQVYALVRGGSLVAIKIGGRGQWRVERDRLEAYIARSTATPPPATPTTFPGTPGAPMGRRRHLNTRPTRPSRTGTVRPGHTVPE